MAYSTQADLLNRMTEPELIQLTDDAGVGAIDAGKISAALRDADAEIDSYAAKRYNIPLVVTDRVRDLSVDIALFKLEQRRRTIREATQAAYERSISFLRDVSKGVATLAGQVAGVATAQASGHDVRTPDRTEQEDKLVFDKDNLEGFR